MKLNKLDSPLIEFGNNVEQSCWTLRHAIEGVQIFGGIGSGKSSGSGRMLALKYLSNQFGGLVLTVKPDEKDMWVNYCRQAGRSNDLIIIEPGGKYHFNFLEYESTSSENSKAITDNIVDVLKTVIRAGEEKDSGKSDDAFWESALDMLIFNVIDLCRLAYDTLSIQHMYDIVQSLPKTEDQIKKPTENDDNKQTAYTSFQKAYYAANENVNKKALEWFEKLPPKERISYVTSEQYNEAVMEFVPEVRVLRFVYDFFFGSFKNLNSRTRSIIEFTFSGFLFRLLRDPVYSLFCRNQSNLVPEDCLTGKIILINLPVKIYHKIGRDCQILFKYLWQRAMEKRQISSSSIPVFLWADEAQNFIHEHDADFQATARSSGISTVYISQNLPNYYASMGGQKAEFKVKSFLGTLATKIFHANADIETNKYASELIGDAEFTDPSRSVTVAKDFSETRSVSIKIDRQVRPEEFVSLKTGGPKNEHRVEGYMHRQGDVLFNRRNFKKMTFDQFFIP